MSYKKVLFFLITKNESKKYLNISRKQYTPVPGSKTIFRCLKTISNNCQQQLFLHICTIPSFICLKIRTPVDDSGPLSYFVGINVTKICILLGSKLKTSRKFFRFYLSALESAGFSSVQSISPPSHVYPAM